MKNTAIYADLPHWSLTGIRSCEDGGKFECSFAETRYLHYLLFNMGLNKPILKIPETNSLQSFRKKYLLKRQFPSDYSLPYMKRMDEYLSAHRFLGLRTTLQVMFYVPDFQSNDANGCVTFLKSRSDEVGHFKKQIQLPVGGGFKSALFGTSKMHYMEQAVSEETKLETGIVAHDFHCVGLTINTRTFCPAFTFFLQLSNEDFMGKFEFEGIKQIDKPNEMLGKPNEKPDKLNKRYVEVPTWVPKKKPRDWWEGDCLIPVQTDCRPQTIDGTLFTQVLDAIYKFFEINGIMKSIDEYVGSCIELYCPDY